MPKISLSYTGTLALPQDSKFDRLQSKHVKAHRRCASSMQPRKPQPDNPKLLSILLLRGEQFQCHCDVLGASALNLLRMIHTLPVTRRIIGRTMRYGGVIRCATMSRKQLSAGVTAYIDCRRTVLLSNAERAAVCHRLCAGYISDPAMLIAAGF